MTQPFHDVTVTVWGSRDTYKRKDNTQTVTVMSSKLFGKLVLAQPIPDY